MAPANWLEEVAPLDVPSAFLPTFKKLSQRRRVRFVGAQSNGINSRAAKQPVHFHLPLKLMLGKGFAFARVVGVYFQAPPGLRILEHQPAQARQFELVWIRDLHCHQIMTSIGLTQRQGSVACRWSTTLIRGGRAPALSRKSDNTTTIARCGVTRLTNSIARLMLVP